MAENTDDHLFDEIEEDLRAERYAKLWKRYGKLVITGIVLLVASVASYQGWQAYDRQQRAEQSERFAAAAKLLSEKKPQEAQKVFSALSAEGRSGYRLLASLRQASILSEKGDHAGAQKIYDAIAADSGFDQIYRDFATLLAVLSKLDTGDPAALIQKLKPLTEDDNTWRFSAKEASALLSLRAGKQKEAYDKLVALANDATTPQGIRARALELSAAIKP